VTALVQAAQKIADGDLSVRVPPMGTRDEVAELALAFNQMTARLDEQRRELVGANKLLDRRRSLIEAVFSGVSAGVIAIDARNQVRMLNASAASLLGVDGDNAPGKSLSTLSAELDVMVSSRDVEGQLQIERKKDTRTLAVRILADSFGHVITFDDITQQLSDQRRAAWADVGRRVAHEIKNPLTPIQLAAERIKRRFGRGERKTARCAQTV
jgi:two-component system nitrogen regulation sensor histidine kinase NtrY